MDVTPFVRPLNTFPRLAHQVPKVTSIKIDTKQIIGNIVTYAICAMEVLAIIVNETIWRIITVTPGLFVA